MRNACAFCGRITLKPAVLIAGNPVGPVCAKRAGLLTLASRKGSLVIAAGALTTPIKRDDKTMDLFAQEAA